MNYKAFLLLYSFYSCAVNLTKLSKIKKIVDILGLIVYEILSKQLRIDL